MIPIVKSHKETDFSVRKLQKQIDKNRLQSSVMQQAVSGIAGGVPEPLAPSIDLGDLSKVVLLTKDYTARFDDNVLLLLRIQLMLRQPCNVTK